MYCNIIKGVCVYAEWEAIFGDSLPVCKFVFTFIRNVNKLNSIIKCLGVSRFNLQLVQKLYSVLK